MARGRVAGGTLVLAAALFQLCQRTFVPGPAGERSPQLRPRAAGTSTVARQVNPADDAWGESIITLQSDSFKEVDRRNRRDVFTYQRWKEHRSTSRYFRNLATTFSSSFAKFIWVEVAASTFAAFCVWLYFEGLGVPARAIAGLATVPAAVLAMFPGHEPPSISALPFSVTVSVLSLLLVFRTNQSYGRWWEARKIWGSIVNKTRDLSRQALARIPEEDKHLRRPIVSLSLLFPRVLMFHLGAQDDEAKEILKGHLERHLVPDEAAKIMNATHKPMTLVGMLSEKWAQARVHPIERMKADNILTDFSDYYGMCERILKTPMPRVYTRFTSRFLSLWLLALPFALYGQTNPHFLIVPITALIAFFIFGISEVGIQIEEPFSILPLGPIGDGIEASCMEAYELHQKKAPVPTRQEMVSS
eukprot:gb/GFBE01065896.1/.p1 GENE.gb/GFBE01065896.1/~~gb/GFBE01065896.1/.p1  ORF type:complete len:417 (+),score=80.73 gb/GFBE01065896.1/:1-1251(+)